MNPPKVFISYSWDNPAHQAWVLNLANRLVENGVDVILDQYELNLGKNLSLFMEKAVREADKVLLILTENYKLKAENRSGGVGYEYSMINTELYHTQANNNKFLPILRGKDRKSSTPIFITAFIDLDMRTESEFEAQFEQLIRTIYGKPKIVKPPLGKMPDFLQDANVQQPKSTTPTPTNSLMAKINKVNDDYSAKKQLQNKKNEIRRLIARDKTKDALQVLKKIATDLADNDLENTAILLSNQYESYAKKNRLNLESPATLGISLNKINASLLEIISDL